MALHGITVCLDLTHPSSEINKSPKPGIERELVWFAIDRRPLRTRLASLAFHTMILDCCCCCCCLSLVEGLSSSRVSPTDSLTLQSSMHFYMHVTPLHRGFEPTMPFHTAYPHVLLCGLAWHLGAVVRLSRDNLSYFSVHCTPFYIADFQSARCYKGQPFRPAQLPHGEPA